MSDPITRLNAALEGRYRVERELGEGGMAPLDSADDQVNCEWLVPVRWRKAFAREEARTFRGVFANQNSVCKLRHPETLRFLEREFQVEVGE